MSNEAISTIEAIRETAKAIKQWGQKKLPINTSGTSGRVWVATNNHYKVASTNGGPQLTKCGRQIGTVTFTAAVELEPIETYTVDGYEYTEYSPKITSAFTLKDNTSSVSTAMISSAILARVSELYIMTGDDGETPFAYKNYIRATYGKTKQEVIFYWTYPYYFKRTVALSSGDDATKAKSGGPKVGVVTVSNFFSKWYNKEINKNATPSLTDYRDYLISRYQIDIVERTNFEEVGSVTRYTNWDKFHQNENASNNPGTGFYFSLFNASDNEEPFGETLAAREASGQLVIEAATNDYQAVNKKQMDAEITKLEKINPRVSYTIRRNDRGVLDITGRDQAATHTDKEKGGMIGWYRIAETDGQGYFSNTFHVQVFVNRPGYLSDITFTVQKAFYDTDPIITVLNNSFRTKYSNPIDKIRVVHSYADKNPAYVEVHICLNSAPDNAWDGTSSEINDAQYKFFVENILTNGTDNWRLINPPLLPGSTKFVESTLVIDDKPNGYEVFEVSPADAAWSNVTRPVSDINNLATKKEVADNLTAIDDRVTFLESTLIEDAEYEVEDAFNTRVTAGGLTIPNGVETEVLKIEGDGGETVIRGIKSVGENLLAPSCYESTKYSNGINFFVKGDGTIALYGKNDGRGPSSFYFVNDNLHLEPGKYILSGQRVTVTKYDASGVSKSVANSFEIEEGEDLHQILIQVEADDTKEFKNFVVKPTLIRGSDYPPGYIPYVEDTLILPEEIKLCSVDNIRDEIDLVNKKHTKKIERKELKSLPWGRGTTWIDGNEVACIYMRIGNFWWSDYDASSYSTPSKLQLIGNGSYTIVRWEGDPEAEEKIIINNITVNQYYYPEDAPYQDGGHYVLLTGKQENIITPGYWTPNFFDYVGDDEIENAIKAVVGDSVIYYEIPPTEVDIDWDEGKSIMESNYIETPLELPNTTYTAYRNGTESIIGEGKAKVTQKYIVLRS